MRPCCFGGHGSSQRKRGNADLVPTSKFSRSVTVKYLHMGNVDNWVKCRLKSIINITYNLIVVFGRLQARVLMFNCFACFWPKGYQRKSLGKSHQNGRYLKASNAKKLCSHWVRTCSLWITGPLLLHLS